MKFVVGVELVNVWSAATREVFLISCNAGAVTQGDGKVKLKIQIKNKIKN